MAGEATHIHTHTHTHTHTASGPYAIERIPHGVFIRIE